MLGIYACVFLFNACQTFRQTGLIITEGYPLTGGYSYVVFGAGFKSGRHRLWRNRDSTESIKLGYHLQSLYFDDRYIAGEVIEWPHYQDRPYGNKHSYFILDTETGEYISGLTTAAFKAELVRQGLPENIQLSMRRDRNWLKKQRSGI
ncbi:MAG: hypothetical protein AAGH67_16335 [Cyanobacteria bacterium P01_H01_bin.162]